LAGAQLLVCPTLDLDVIRTGHRYGALVIPGCSTPTEMVAAVEHGADAVKVFPTSVWTPASLADVRSALPQLPLVPTGGIRVDDAADWLRAGAIAVGIGSELTAGGLDMSAERVARLKRVLSGQREPFARTYESRVTRGSSVAR
jgi:2-dehydro-3-deoxyphosphogluconate aldolase/(4S)-4-hydroxy-2-oxoglutarate aldolase